jgi:hypothetical protein
MISSDACVGGAGGTPAFPLMVDKSAEHVELLHLNDSGIRVAQYLTELPPKKLLEKKLHQAIQLARERLARSEPSRQPTIMPRKKKGE